LFCTGADTCLGGSCSVHAGSPCGANTDCDEATDSCTPCARLTLPATQHCFVGQTCTVSVGLAAGGLSIGSVSASLVAGLGTTCSGCSVGLAASNGTCSFNSGCAFAVSDVTPPPTAFSDGVVARPEVNCSHAGDGTLCIDNTAAASAGFGPVFACPVEQCASYQ